MKSRNANFSNSIITADGCLINYPQKCEITKENEENYFMRKSISIEVPSQKCL